MKSVKQIKKNQTLLLHIIAWAVIFLLPYIFTSAYYDGRENELHGNTTFLYVDTVTKIFWVGLFYLNTERLVPAFVYKRKYILFVFTQVILFSLIMLIHGGFFKLMITGKTFSFINSSSHNIITFLFTVIASIAYKTISDRAKSQQESNERINEHLKTELSFLRSQISPHFLFNVMNNIAALARLKSDELEPTVHKLSSLMQYMLYETDEEKVLLQSEIENLQSYIDLQRQRFSEKLILHVSLDAKENWHTIEPMLLIPFVENAFKHGTGLVQNPAIEIELKAEHDKLCFIVKNKFIQTETVKDKTSGIGLANVKRRLELLYSHRHLLTINKTNDRFIVSLELTFKS
ncbi:histidine kinase [Ferruginibacter paludis]|uniref:sensor histidine kinase n=1 Tax=Ferruginibacter paludis TaxID=1310417 RepID=UPI0025B2B94F|nr:histidine kinase [Ferruginibacter paludis]MDN3656736.1 histidine kinase [Ferruginibacter paludis]